jgi:2-C-methyl-D-erythritol 2,4-cyclodiphosphate synthase
MRIGIGYDVHTLKKDRKLILGGVEIDHPFGCMGHSDSDVLVHAIMDAILGAAALGDIGIHFPDTDMRYKDIDSTLLLAQVIQKMKEKGYKIVNCDSVIIMQKPKVSPYMNQMRSKLSKIMEIGMDQLSIKATTTERLGFAGRGEGVAAESIVLLEKR